MELTITERVAKGAAFLDEHFTGWWERIDLSILNISSCTTCVLGQLWCTSAPAEQEQIIAQAVQIFYGQHWDDSEDARSAALYDSPFGRVVSAYRELHRLGAKELGFAWYGGSNDCDSVNEAMDLTDEWTRVIIQRRLDAHPDVVLGCSDLSRIASEQYAAVI